MLCRHGLQRRWEKNYTSLIRKLITSDKILIRHNGKELIDDKIMDKETLSTSRLQRISKLNPKKYLNRPELTKDIHRTLQNARTTCGTGYNKGKEKHLQLTKYTQNF